MANRTQAAGRVTPPSVCRRRAWRENRDPQAKAVNTPIGIALLLALVGSLLWVILLRRRQRLMAMRLREARKSQEAVISLIDKLGEKITSKIDLDETLDFIASYVVEEVDAEAGAIFLRTGEASGYLQARAVVGPFPPLHETHEHVLTREKYLVEKIKTDRIEVGEGIIGVAAEQDRPMLIRDAEADPLVPHTASQLSEIRSLMLCPVRVRGMVLGVFVVVNKRGEGRRFEQRDMNLLQALADMAAVTADLVKLYDVLAEQQRLEQELSIAHDFQRMLLPENFPRQPGFEFYAMSQAATVVGGDYFDFFEVDEDHLGLVIADVSGKGIPGALVMAMVRSVLRAEARGLTSPKDALRQVNERIIGDIKENVFITMTYAILNVAQGTLRFVRAGHEPLLIIDRATREVREFAPEGIALGLVRGELFDHNEEQEIQLRPGEVALLYTDGVVEAMDQASREYGRDRLVSWLEHNDPDSAEQLVSELAADIHRFTLGIPQHDDITMLAIRAVEPAAAARGEDTCRRTA